MGPTTLVIMPATALFQSTHPVWDGTKFAATPDMSDEFQSTHPVWDGTSFPVIREQMTAYFNPPIPCGMGPRHGLGLYIYAGISIHPSRVGWDSAYSSRMCQNGYFNPPIPCGMGLAAEVIDHNPFEFQSTHPVWDGTKIETPIFDNSNISIHPSRVGWDESNLSRRHQQSNFNPPIPCGMGRYHRRKRRQGHNFNPPIPCGMGQQKIYDYIHFLR